MDTPTRAANVGLVALALVAAGTTGFAVWNVRQPPAGSADLAGRSTASLTLETPVTASPDDAARSSDTPDADPAASVDAWADVVLGDDAADLLVIGDGYSNLADQWLELWAERVAEGGDRPVTIRHWAEADDVTFADPIQLAEGDDGLSVWSASRGETTISDAAARVGDFIDASTEPDAVLVTLGRDSEDEDVAAGLDALSAELPDVPVLISVGPSGLYDDDVLDATATWAEEHEDDVAHVDLRELTSESPDAEAWARAFEEAIDRR